MNHIVGICFSWMSASDVGDKMIQEQLRKALEDLRKEKKRNFDQTLDLIVNLQKFDVKKNQINTFIRVPNKIKDKKIVGFLEVKRNDLDVITPSEFKKFKDKKMLKKLVKKYDFFIAQANLMPQIASNFGRVLGPAGKMPSPQLGILTEVSDKVIEDAKSKVNRSIKVRIKQPSIKLIAGKYSMPDEKIIENILTIYRSILKILPREKENIKNLEVKFTMTKPVKIKVR